MTMQRLTSIVLALVLVVAACGDDGSGAPTTGVDGADRAQAYVGSVEFVYLESYPVQVQAIVVGDLPTPCHELTWDLDDTVSTAPVLEVWSTIDITVTCIQVLEPFEETIGIGSFETGSYVLEVNGESYPFEI